MRAAASLVAVDPGCLQLMRLELWWGCSSLTDGASADTIDSPFRMAGASRCPVRCVVSVEDVHGSKPPMRVHRCPWLLDRLERVVGRGFESRNSLKFFFISPMGFFLYLLQLIAQSPLASTPFSVSAR